MKVTVLTLSLLLSSSWPLGNSQTRQSSGFDRALSTDAPLSFALLGDTQRTLSIEELVLGREQNEQPRRQLMESLVQEDIAFALIAGDLVSWGNDDEWNYFDGLTATLRARVPLFAAVGNHEYFGNDKVALDHLHRRFHRLATKHWYVLHHSRIALVVLDSNEVDLPTKKWTEQKIWFQETLHTLDNDPNVSSVLVVAHHPPFTNSTTTSDETHVQEAFLPAVFQSQKVVAFVTGHAHGYEHFIKQGRHFIVTGGAGGPRVKHRMGAKAKHENLYTGRDPGPFHYLVLTPKNERLEISVKGFHEPSDLEAEGRARTVDSFQIPYP